MEKSEETNKVVKVVKIAPLKEDAKVAKEGEKLEEPKELSRAEKVEKLALELYEESKKEGDVWVTLIDETRNFWNSGDYLHFYISQGRCKKLPKEPSPILRNAMGDTNLLLREAEPHEVKKELVIIAEDKLIKELIIEPIRFQENGEPLKL